MKWLLLVPAALALGGLGVKLYFARMSERKRLDTMQKWGGDY